MTKARRLSLTPEQDAEFDRLLAVWQRRLNLLDWRIERGTGRAPGALASVTPDFGARLATYRTGAGWTSTSSEAIEAIVVHELLHVELAELLHLTAAKADADTLESAEHRVIHTLVKLLTRPTGEN